MIIYGGRELPLHNKTEEIKRMEVKAVLIKPYTEKEKLGFIVKFNHQKGYEIKEEAERLIALGMTDEEIKQKERERINLLSLTKREVFLALYKAKGITPDQIKSQITEPEALIEFEYANEYFRGNPLIDLIGAKLGYTSDDLDYLFINKELPEKPVNGDELTDLLNFTSKDIENINNSLPAEALEAEADSAEDLNPSAVKFD